MVNGEYIFPDEVAERIANLASHVEKEVLWLASQGVFLNSIPGFNIQVPFKSDLLNSLKK